MEANDRDVLVKLSDTDETVKLGDEDIRGYSVKDNQGADIGKIQDLLIDPRENIVRFLVVESGGFLGIGQSMSFIPVDAISRVTEDEVQIDQTRQKVAGAPAYDPDLVSNREYQESMYGYYRYAAYWSANYKYPGSPSLR